MSLKDILKTENIIKSSSQATLSSVLSKLRSSHDAAFVFDENNKYLGVINPYYCLIKSSHPGNAKVLHCLYHPPKIYIYYPLTKVAQLFIESKVHYLPVFDEKDEFLGIISARRLLSHFDGAPIFKEKIKEILKKKKPLSVVYENDNLSSALSLFKKYKFSKLLVVDTDFKLKGILSYFDIIYYLIQPKDSQSKGEREGGKVNYFHQPIKNFMKTFVLTLTEDDLLQQALHLILTKKIGSVIILGEKKKPIGIITTRDLLSFFIKKEEEKKTLALKQFFKKIFPSDTLLAR